MQLGESLPDRIQFHGQPAKEQCELLTRRRPSPASPPRPVRPNLSIVEIIDHRGISCHRRALRWLLPALILLVWLGSAAPLSALGGEAHRPAGERHRGVPPRQRRVHPRAGAAGRSSSPPSRSPPSCCGRATDAIDEATLAEIGERIEAATQVAEDADALAGEASPPIPSEDGEAVQAFLPLEPDLSDDLLPLVEDLRAAIAVDGTDSFVTGPAGIFADFSSAFEGIDGLLLLAAFGVVLVILLVVYRSPLLPFLVIATAGLALTAANAVAYLLADGGVITVNGQSQGIASILVVGAATDYGLLLVARFREELRLEQSKYAAMRIALRQSWEPIVASGATVVLGVLCLLLSDLGLQPRARPDLRGERHPRRRRRAHLPAGGARAARPGRVLAVPPAVRRRAEARAAAGRGSPRSSAAVRGGCSRCSVAGADRRRRRSRPPTTPTASRSPTRSRASRTASPARRRSAGTSTPAPAARRSSSRRRTTWPEVAEAAAAADGVAAVAPFTGGPPGPGAQPVVVDGLVRLDATLAGHAGQRRRPSRPCKTLRTTLDDADPEAIVGGETAEQPRRPRERAPATCG